MKEYAYQLAKKGKWTCPACQHKTFVLYVDASGDPLNEGVGKCDRADNCAYHYTPRQYFADNGIAVEQRPKKPAIKPAFNLTPSFIDANTLKASLKRYEDNAFVTYLTRLFGVDGAERATAQYYVGTSSHWAGANVFWQIDRHGRVHGGKIMVYDPMTGKRIKQPRSLVTWVHTALKLDNFNLVQCLFGEHLLSRDGDSLVVIVESEKTAIICSRLVPDAVWLACGGCQNLSKKICQPLAGRNVLLMPDNGKFDDWAKRGRDLLGLCKSVRISDIMELKAAQPSDDLCDLLTARYLDDLLDETVFADTMFHTLRN